MNDREQFYKEFYSALEKGMEPSGGHLIEMDIPKNNGSVKGITIKFDNIALAPTVNPDIYYQDWKDGQLMSDIVSGIRSKLIKTVPGLSHFNVGCIKRDSAITHLHAAVVGYENNKEWLKDIPHERLADLAVFAKWKFDNADPDLVVASKITEPLLAQLRLTKEEALKIAKANTARSARFESMDTVMKNMMVDDGMDKELAEMMFPDSSTPLSVVTNESGIEGAAVIACPEVLKAVQKELGEDFYILPSSIHEVLVLPKSFSDDVEDLKQMVSSVNEAEVPPEDRLSDQVYEFDGHSLKIAGAELTQENNIADSITHHRSR
ncbi:hypothetical protein DW886_03560 [Enterocloster aldenensis]|uniref:DUF5688 family protein n=1 Tax=Enterocloster aldenensis TaxID=358742 RepID=UPI000E493DAE|nr:hypothetical protein DW886_03560 [Enterocloster aldenensis]